RPVCRAGLRQRAAGGRPERRGEDVRRRPRLVSERSASRREFRLPRGQRQQEPDRVGWIVDRVEQRREQLERGVAIVVGPLAHRRAATPSSFVVAVSTLVRFVVADWITDATVAPVESRAGSLPRPNRPKYPCRPLTAAMMRLGSCTAATTRPPNA